MTMNFLPMSFKILHIRYCIHVTLIKIFRSFAIHTCDVHGQCRSRLRLTTLIWSPIARVITLLTRITTPVKVRLSPALLLLETWPTSVNTNRWPKQFKYTRTPLAPCISPKTPFFNWEQVPNHFISTNTLSSIFFVIDYHWIKGCLLSCTIVYLTQTSSNEFLLITTYNLNLKLRQYV